MAAYRCVSGGPHCAVGGRSGRRCLTCLAAEAVSQPWAYMAPSPAGVGCSGGWRRIPCWSVRCGLHPACRCCQPTVRGGRWPTRPTCAPPLPCCPHAEHPDPSTSPATQAANMCWPHFCPVADAAGRSDNHSCGGRMTWGMCDTAGAADATAVFSPLHVERAGRCSNRSSEGDLIWAASEVGRGGRSTRSVHARTGMGYAAPTEAQQLPGPALWRGGE